jgi:hypothetical protein
MARARQRINRFADRHKGLLAILAIALVLVPLTWPRETQEAVKDAQESTFWSDVTDFFAFGNGTLATSGSGDLREAQVKYDAGKLSSLGVTTLEGGGNSPFAVDGTTTSGEPAKFELVCGDKVCGTITDHYQEPLTYWIVTIPDKQGLTKLAVTAGAAYLEVEL